MIEMNIRHDFIFDFKTRNWDRKKMLPIKLAIQLILFIYSSEIHEYTREINTKFTHKLLSICMAMFLSWIFYQFIFLPIISIEMRENY